MNFAKHIQVRNEKFGAVVFDTLREKVFVTNETGAAILALLLADNAPEAIIAELAKGYDADATVVARDVGEFISMLSDNGIAAKEEHAC